MTLLTLQDIWRMHQQDIHIVDIAASTHIDRSTVSRYLKKVEDSGLVIQDPITEEQAEQIRTLILTNPHPARDNYLEPNWEYYHGEMAGPYVTLLLLHTEYLELAAYMDKKAYSYSHFARKYREYCKVKRLVMRMDHKPGMIIEYDWAGGRMSFTNPENGEIVKMSLYIAVLPYSRLFYANVYVDTKEQNWCDAVCETFEYFGGVSTIMRPDNLKTAVIKHTREEIIIQKDFRELSDHYDSAVIPTGVRSPTHKSAAESTVKTTEHWIIGKLRHMQFFSEQEVRDAVKKEIEDLNNKYSESLYSSPRELFEREERAFLKPLPPVAFTRSHWQTGTIANDYLVKYGKNSYSVPYAYVGKPYEARLKNGMVEIYSDSVPIATHEYVEEHQRNVIVKPEHRPKNHQEVANYTPEHMREYGRMVGPATLWAMEYHLTKGKIELQGIQFCVSIRTLGEHYGREKLESACRAIQKRGDKPEVRMVTEAVKAVAKATKAEMAHATEGFTRGADQFNM